MKRKTAERELKGLANNIRIFSYKFRDRGYISCPHCHRPLVTCPTCRKDMLMPKAQSYPDYLLCKDPIFVEVKFGRERYNWDDISPIQRESLSNNENSWVFLIIGEGRVPDGRGAWLVPWDEYVAAEYACTVRGQKSILFEATSRSTVPEADHFWAHHRLRWNKGGWEIPSDHIWWAINTRSANEQTTEKT